MKKIYTFKWKKIVTFSMILFSWFFTQAHDYRNPLGRSYNTSGEVNSFEHISLNPVCFSTSMALSTPALNSPPSNFSTANDIFVDFILPLDAMPGSVTLTFIGSMTVVVTFDNTFENAGQHSTTLDVSDIINSPSVASSNSSFLPDGTYSVQLGYLDTTGNPFLSDINTNITYDSVTLPPVLISPVDNASTTPGSSLIDLQYTLPEQPLAGTVTLTFTDASNNDTVLLLSDATSFNGTIDGLNFASTPEIITASSNSLADGIYDITLEYQDSLGNPIATDTATGFSFGDVVTLPPVLISPADNASTTPGSSLIDLQYTLPEQPLAGSVTLTFTDASNNDTVLTLSDATSFSGNIDGLNFASTPEILVASSNSLADGIYDITLEYQDSLGNPIATDTATGFSFGDVVTLPPVLISPADNASTTPGSSLIDLQYTLPETPLSGSVTLTFTDASNNDTVLLLSDATSFSGNIDGLNFASTPEILVASSNSLADGIYDITLEYQDSLGNPIATDTATGFSFGDVVTLSPVLISPVDNASTTPGSSLIDLQYTLPEQPLAGTVRLTFTDAGNNDTVLTLSDATSFSGTIDGLNFASTPEILVASSNSLADGIYDITLEYQDSLGNPIATDTATGFSFGDVVTLPPVLISPADNASTTPGSSLIDLQYTLPEQPLAGSVTLTFTDASNNDTVLLLSDATSFSGNIDGLNFASTPEILVASSNSLADGTYDITLEYQDSLGNPIATDTATGFSFDTATLSNDTFQYNDFTILPNPTTSKIVISTKENIKNISLISSIGSQFHVKIDDSINEKYSVDMSNLSNGMYFVVIETDSTYYTRKIIKK
ncbi:T9SS type A sorting domain-containing protein [uncultured Aquimarina sp.]|uniref:T9SS type A sorting domain-containing protein n=1 Tax=uncultured Aquimarina sp. TaxID=575652 RepID=UPI002631A1B8|nr:T9SS type A sorting domain-containing protein [uncultured Aquimarina sp.]